MAAHHAAGEPGRALAVYARLRTALADELGADPSPETRALHAAVLRGEPVAAPARPPSRLSSVRTVPAGREAELARLTACWSAATTGEAALMLVTGDAGIGKTTLAEAVSALVTDTGGQVLAARCYAAEQSLLLQPILDALGPTIRGLPPGDARRLAGLGAGVLAGLLPDAAALLGEPDTDRGSPEMERRRVYDAVGGFVRALAATRPVLLLLDDLHNAGLATVELLHYLAARPAGARLLVLATIRTEEGAEAIEALADIAVRIDVGPLAPDAVALLAARAGAPRLAEDILRRTRGHTLFVVETLRGIAAGEDGVPESLQAAVLARMRRAGSDVEQVLRAGAVLGAAVAPDTVAAMLDLPVPDVLNRLAEAAAARLLVAGGEQYEFANDLVQEVLYATTPVPARHAYHRRAADLLADRSEVVAGHAAALADWPRAARAWLTAGERAVGRYAPADGQALLDRALDAAARSDDPALTGRIHLVRARALEVLGNFAGAITDLRATLAVARQAGDRRLEMAALRRHAGDVCSALGLPERELQLDAALRIAVGLDDEAAQADLYGWQAVVAANRLRFTDAVALGGRAVAAGRAADDDDALIAGLDGLKTAFAYLGEIDQLCPVLGELEPLLRRSGDLLMLRWTVFESALPAVAAARWDTAVGLLDEALAINRRSGQATHEPWFLAHRGWVERLRGDLDAAVTFGERAVGPTNATAHPWWQATSAALLATTLLERGEAAEAVRLLSAVRAVAERSGTEAYLLRCLAPMAEATGDRRILGEADALLTGISAPPGRAWLAGGDAYLSVARAWLTHHEPFLARAALAPLLSAADRNGWLPWQAAGALVDGAALAELGDRAAAEQRYTRAQTLATAHAMPAVADSSAAHLRDLAPR